MKFRASVLPCLILLVANLAVVAQDDPHKVVQLERTETQIIGTLDLGRIQSDQSIECKFVLKNSTDGEVGIVRLAPSCACTSIELNKSLLKPGESSNPGIIGLKPTKARGHVTFATVEMFGPNADRPIGKLRIIADVDRPFAIDQTHKVVTLSGDTNQTIRVTLRVDPKVELGSVEVRSVGDVLESKLTRLVDDRDECELELAGDRAKLLAARFVPVNVTYNNSDRTKNLTDTLTLEFFDGSQARVVPSLVTVENKQASFVIYRRAPIDFKNLQCLDAKGDPVKARFSKRTEWMFSVDADVMDGQSGDAFTVTDGMFRTEVALSFSKKGTQ